ncbi:MAG: amino acid permease [Myxococcales bacterium]|nr:amino acid permease [Myxococcales bacterium]
MTGKHEEQHAPSLSWREGLFLVGPDPLTSPYYASGFLLLAGVGYATPAFQIGLYLLLFLLAPLYIEAVLLTLSNGGTYVMTRYALGHLGKLAIIAAALVGVIISFSYVATAIVSLLSYSDYVMSLVRGIARPGARALAAIGLSAIPSIAFGVWVMPRQWRRISIAVLVTSVLAAVLSSVMSAKGAVVMFAPLIMLFILNNEGLKESVKVSKTIFLINLLVMSITIIFGLLCLVLQGGNFEALIHGVQLPAGVEIEKHDTGELSFDHSFLPGLAMLGAPLILAGVGSSILGASGVESVMNIPEELQNPRRDVPKIYTWMLSILLAIGGSTCLLVFLIVPPEILATHHGELLAILGKYAVEGVTGSPGLASVWQVVIVANAAFMLIGATNTGFAGARGLWRTMARDDLMPRALLTPNTNGAFERIHWLMLVAAFLLAMEAGWSLPVLERWYGATFALVMFSGMVAFILLRKFKGNDRRVYTAPWNIRAFGTTVPIGAVVGLAVLSYALLSMWSANRVHIDELRDLVTIALVLVGLVLLSYNHRPLMRAGYRYFRQVVETVPSTAIETQDRTVVVAVNNVRIGRLLSKAFELARLQTKTTGIPYRQVVVFHMTSLVSSESVYRVAQDSVRPEGIEGNIVRIFSELTELAPDDITVYLALVPDQTKPGESDLRAALDSLVEFHARHHFKGHMVMVGTYGLDPELLADLQDRLTGSTLVPVPLFGE